MIMDVSSSSLHVNNYYNQAPSIATFSHRNSMIRKPFSYNSIRVIGFTQFEDKNPVRYIKSVSKKVKVFPANRSLIVRATREENDDSHISGESGDQSIPDDGSKGTNRGKLDWRTVRAGFVARKEVLVVDSGSTPQEGGSSISSMPLGSKWSHPLSALENGCVLVATEKLDGVQTFERTVVFLLRSGNTDPRQGPFGLVINRPLQKRIKDMNPTNQKLATTFADCFLHFGGPLEASMFLLSTGESSQSLGLEMVIPGLCYGARNRLDEAAGLVKKGILKPQDFRFFVGYAGWQMNQLREEIESGFWVLAATSPNLIWESLSCSSSEGLWEEVLQLMGGQYAEISRKPKRNG
ncbi:uncharacterized protein LOC113283333 isoform X4 [Papaver somniferum]|uniref:uncharacterized protein LOC113283333 isoform X4 n=1 Tax=Papaver somniferum TaxID=3469 RepID=UPI000E6F9465|nr:uncharacterized protein LOC113283333 isoform X4 [Papaver somniferum]